MGGGIEADGLTKRFGDRVAVEDLTFTIEPGEVFGFLGPNGAGKTTTVRMLATLIRPTSGKAAVAGIPLDQGPALRRRIGVMPETHGLYLKLTLHDNLSFFAGLYGVENADERIAWALDAVGLGDRAGDLAGTLSKGLRQRAGLARSLIGRPEVLFLDEPTSGLDPEATLEVRELISDLRRHGVTVFLTTHRLEEAERLCDRVGILKTRLVSIGTPTELRRSLGSALEVEVARPLDDPAGVFAEVPGVAGWSGSDGRYRLETADPRAAAPAVARALVRAGADVVRLAETTHSLEDAYLELLGER